MEKKTILEEIKGKLIVSCQALPGEALYVEDYTVMHLMAKAAQQGGAAGIRANSAQDIKEIKKNVNLPIVGIIKRVYPGSEVYITPTIKEVDELMEVQPEIIAVDASSRTRPNHQTLEEFYQQIKEKYPHQLLMADCSTIREAIYADQLGFDMIGTTLVGYTPESEGVQIEKNDFEFLKELLACVKGKVIAEGNIDTPEKARRVLELGCYSVVVGGAITRPQLITEKYVEAIKGV